MGHFNHLEHSALTDVGRRRKNNEDAFGEFPSAGVFCVADGMGGGDDGEVASAAVVRAVEMFASRHPLPENAAYSSDGFLACLKNAVSNASKWIFDRANARQLKGCGSTFVGVCFDAACPHEAKALHAGDSRLYRIRGKSILQITKDHSAAEMIGAKDESEVNPMFRGMILRAVGTQPRVELDVTPFDVKEGDFVLVCSDGLYRMVPEKRIVSIVRQAESPKEAVELLVSAANDAGGIDNVTAVLVKVGALPAALPAVDMPNRDDDNPSGESESAEEQVTRDTNSKSLATFNVDSVTSATSSDSLARAGASTSPALTIPEEPEAVQPVERAHGQDKEGVPKVSRGAWTRFFAKNRRTIIYCVAAFLGVCILSGLVVGVAHAIKTSNEKERAVAAAKAELEEALRQMREETEEKRIAEEKAAREAEEKRIAEEKRAAEEKAAREAEEKRIAEEKRLAEEKAESERRALAEQEARRNAAIRERARPMLEDADFYCDNGEPLMALKSLKAANDIGYLLSEDELRRVRDVYSKKVADLNRRIRNKNMATPEEREQYRHDLAELTEIFVNIKSEKPLRRPGD